MIVYSLLTFTIFIALSSLVILWRATTARLEWHRIFLSASLLVFVYLYGTWVFLSVYAKYIYCFCFILALVAGLWRKNTVTRAKPSKLKILVNLFLSGVFITLSGLYFTGTTGKPYGIAHLDLPFKKGNYFVFQGGKGLPTNVFHYGLRGAVFAIDLVKLNKAGNRAKHIFSKKLEDYEIFGDTIYSPCDGVVIKTADNNDDNIPPERKRGPGNTNQVLIETDSFYVFMGHLKHGSVLVKQHDTVKKGQPLGCVGNSGFSLEPHLHIQVHAKTDRAIPWYKEKPLLIEFDDRSYLLFEEIKAAKS